MYTGQLSFGHANKKTSVRTFVIFFLYRDRYQPVSMTAASDIRREWNENNNCQCQWSRRVCAIVVTIEVIDFYYLNRNNRDVRKRKKKKQSLKNCAWQLNEISNCSYQCSQDLIFFIWKKSNKKFFFILFLRTCPLPIFFFFWRNFLSTSISIV